MTRELPEEIVHLEGDSPFERTFAAYSVVVVGTREEDGRDDFAPKHMATPLGWSGYFGFACTEEHSTTKNLRRTREFTVSYPRPEAIVSVGLSAEPRDEAGQKPDLDSLETLPAQDVDAGFIKQSYLFLECEVLTVVEDLGENNFVIGEIVTQHVHRDALRGPDRDDADLIHENPILAYLHPGRYATIDRSQAFPYPRGFTR